MGCFLSSSKKTLPNSNTKLQSTTTHRSPPLTLPFLEEEEEEVKEILSETPIIINNPIIHSSDEKKKQCHIHDSHVLKIAKIINPKDELSREPSDMYRKFSRSIRVGSDPKEIFKELSRNDRVESDPKETIKDVGAELQQRSPAKYRNTSPAKRPEQLPGSGQILNTSPARRADHISGSGQTRNTSPCRIGSERSTGGLSRKDNGESSCRRSRSPVMCADQINGGTRNSISRCPSVRKSGKSPGRVRSELGDRRRSLVEAGNGSRSNRENRENNNYKRPLTSGINESLENPLVSLECFIFI